MRRLRRFASMSYFSFFCKSRPLSFYAQAAYIRDIMGFMTPRRSLVDAQAAQIRVGVLFCHFFYKNRPLSFYAQAAYIRVIMGIMTLLRSLVDAQAAQIRAGVIFHELAFQSVTFLCAGCVHTRHRRSIALRSRWAFRDFPGLSYAFPGFPGFGGSMDSPRLSGALLGDIGFTGLSLDRFGLYWALFCVFRTLLFLCSAGQCVLLTRPGFSGLSGACLDFLGSIVLSGARLDFLGLLGSPGPSSDSAGLSWKLLCSSVLFMLVWALLGSSGLF